MDQARLVIAIVLSILVFVVWDYFFVDKKTEQQPKQPQSVEQGPKEEKKTVENQVVIDKAPAPIKGVSTRPARPARNIKINLPLYSVVISEKGAVFKRFILKNYRQAVDADSPSMELISEDLPGGTVRLGFFENSVQGIDGSVFTASLENDAVDILDKPREVSFSWTSPQGVVVEKKFLFSPESYMIDLNVVVRNGSKQTLRDNLTLTLANPELNKKSRIGFEGPSALINNELEQVKTKKIKGKTVFTGILKWIAIQDRYFMSAIIPNPEEEASMNLSINENKILTNQYVQPVRIMEPGTQNVFKYKLFFGPKSMKVLKELDFDLVKAVNFGLFDVIAKPCVWIMDFIFEHVISNYGVAIIILTLLTKILLWPLGTKSYKSMSEMKKIQPLMAEIKEKYKDDKKKMNEEMMGLYRTYKVNPLGGCLPMVVQIPVFFALYRMLYEAIELRHAPFFWWITDLSAPDRLFRFDFSIPFMEPPYGIPVLTIIMGATMFLQQKMSPPMGDPAQAKMMMLMPIIFTVIFINFSSGLVLYWLVNNIISMAQQYYVSNKTA